ncbi:MAG: rhamnulokinase [Candidatus Aminicenantes bacterium]|nr:rhamnulokinase [Candidatus Aminicenantes bacterium]
MSDPIFLAVDIGAGSGRVFLGSTKKSRLSVKEVFRFPNTMRKKGGCLHWDIHDIFGNVVKGLRIGAEAGSRPVCAVGIDTWGVDFGLLDENGSLLGLPFAYRDSRNEQAVAEYFTLIPRETIYALTGIQFLQFNSLYQLYALKKFNPEMLARADKLLFIPDLINYFLTGEKATEFTYATTSQMFNPLKRRWEQRFFEVMNVPSSLMLSVVDPGTTLGSVRESVKLGPRLAGALVLAVASHDTAAAVAAVPADGRDWAFISSGTWSIMGVERDAPVITERTLRLNFTNEGGIGGTFRLCKNISGLWLLQECRRAWSAAKEYNYEELINGTRSAPVFRALVDPDWAGFLNPNNMPEAIDTYCLKTKQPAPQNPSDYVHCILESLALKYRYVLDELRTVHSHPVRKLHLIGGGVQNTRLCQWTADATELPLTAGPAEATAVGNLLVQGLGTGVFQSIEEMRAVVRNSFAFKEYQPRITNDWEGTFLRFRDLVEQTTGL